MKSIEEIKEAISLIHDGCLAAASMEDKELLATLATLEDCMKWIIDEPNRFNEHLPGIVNACNAYRIAAARHKEK